MAEASAPVDQAQPAEMGGGTDAFQDAAVDSYNTRAAMDSDGQAPNGVDMAPPPQDGGNGQAQDEMSDDTSAVTMEPDSGGDEEPQPDQVESSEPEVQAGDQVGGEAIEFAHENDAPESENDESFESPQNESEEGNAPEDESLSPSQDADSPEIWQEDAAGKQEANQRAGDNEQPQTHEPKGDKVKPHKLKYDKDKEKELARRQMMNPPLNLPTDFSKYFDVRTGEGPKQPMESPVARANRRLDELKAWRKKMEEQSPLVYNRKASKPRA
jgi:hypothetical protein